MKDRDIMVREFRELERAIERLKSAEKELDDLKPFENVFGSEMESIRRNLKRPIKVDQVERALGALRKQIEERKQRAAQAAMEEPKPPPEPVRQRRPTPSFLPELEEFYSDVSFIGSGGFARVFRAMRKTDGKEVAVKVPTALDATTGRSFVKEITSWQRLRHTNIVELYDLNILPAPYLEMELCQESLEELHKPLQVEQAARLMFQVAEGLKYAHSQGIIHRDLKPPNILLKDEVPKVSDWGLSKIAAGSRSSALSGFSPIYAAPEQVAPRKFGRPDERTDIYQWGTSFYVLLTGRSPFEAEDVTELLAQIVTAEPEHPSTICPDARDVEPIVMKCLQKRKEERYQTVAELHRDLAEYLKAEYQKSLSQSGGDKRRSGYYCSELCMVHLQTGDMAGALKYLMDLKNYAGKETKEALTQLISELEFRQRQEMPIPEGFLDRATIVVHQAKMRW